MISAVKAVLAVIEVLEEDEQWVYVTDPSYNNCEHCLNRDGDVYTRNQELDIIDIFPDYIQESPTVILPRVHMTLWGKDSCKCKMFLSNLAKLDDHKPESPILDDPEKPAIPLPDKTIPEPKPILLTPEQTQLTGNQYTDFLGNLLSLTYISFAAYTAIIGRRNRQDMTKQEIIEYLKTINPNSDVWVQIQKLIKDA
jgi:hypothetical protein